MKLNPLTAIDFYKADHRRQYPAGTSLVYSNFTARDASHSPIPKELFSGKITFFGLQYFIKSFLIEVWDREFFRKPVEVCVAKYERRMDRSLGQGAITYEHIYALHKLGHLPLCIRALPEGDSVPLRVPVLTMFNTHPDFFWLTNYLETVMSSYLWKPITSATIAKHYRTLLEAYATQTGTDPQFVDFQAHDFSFRGMSGPEDAIMSGMGHLTSFKGTDTVPAIDNIEEYYGGTNAPVGFSVPATEHSVMCMGTKESEVETFRRLITQLYPKGIVSIVSDTWDFWKVICGYAAELKEQIMAREGRVVFRPDSGNPVKIICGDSTLAPGSPARKGAVECLWDLFGGTTNKAGYKVLDSHVGLIYGDSITLERADEIMYQLEEKGFASQNVVLGVGSYTYEHVTRDSFGFAMKSTGGAVGGVNREIFKDPITDNGVKKSLKGFIKVVQGKDGYIAHDQQVDMEVAGDCMRTVYKNGRLIIDDTIDDIRKRVREAK